MTKGEASARRGRITVSAAAARGFAPESAGHAASLELVYAGPTAPTAVLASGGIRHQLGLKLRAEDSCNLVYVMWRLGPRPEIVVELKRNPGMTRHEECGTAGYLRIAPLHRGSLPLLVAGSSHRLAAVFDGAELVVWADHQIAWRGTVPEAARGLRGPAGFRTDNVAGELALFAPTGDREVPCLRDHDDE